MEPLQWLPKLNRDTRSLGTALIEALEADILNGILLPGQKLPPQRELADQLGINLSTVTRAFRTCELKGLIHGVVGRGTFVASDARIPLSLVTEDNSTGVLDMGQVLPLPCLDHMVAGWVRDQLPSMDLEPLLRYPEPSGLKIHREIGAQWLSRFGITANREDVVITPGTQNALTNCLVSLFRPGDRVAVDALTYPGFKSLAALVGIRLVPIAMTPEGMSVQGLLHACRNEGVKGIYLMPEVQNPTTAFMTEARREELAAVIRQHQLILMEDDTYSYTGDMGRTPMCARVPEQGIYLAGTSKMLGPGFRITFAKVPKSLQASFEKGLLNTTWMASPINAEIITRLIRSGKAVEAIHLKREESARRFSLAMDCLGALGLQGREHGFFAWLPLPSGYTGREFELSARAAGVQVFCAEKFAVGSGAVSSAVRISLSSASNIQELARGLQLLKIILQSGAAEPKAIL